jgi:hypothetical protein
MQCLPEPQRERHRRYGRRFLEGNELFRGEHVAHMSEAPEGVKRSLCYSRGQACQLALRPSL